MTTAVEPREHTVEANGLRFRYVEWGEPGAPPMVLLHGLSSTCRIWDAVARAFQDRYHILAPDQRGHGETSWPEAADYTTDDYVADLEALVDGWGLDRFALVGLSMGGMNAIAYAARHPDRVTHVVPIDIPPKIAREKRPSLEIEKHISEHGHPIVDTHDAQLMLVRLSNKTTPEPALRHRLSHLLKQLPDGKWQYKHDPRVSYYWEPSDLWEELPNVQAPVLIVRGGKSEVVRDTTAERMLAEFPNAELVTIEPSGHTVPEDAPEEFIAALDSFLSR
ncbi:MAG: alpha/beta hydrolase [Dehalococcoidia bacterium]